MNRRCARAAGYQQESNICKRAPGSFFLTPFKRILKSAGGNIGVAAHLLHGLGYQPATRGVADSPACILHLLNRTRRKFNFTAQVVANRARVAVECRMSGSAVTGVNP